MQIEPSAKKTGKARAEAPETKISLRKKEAKPVEKSLEQTAAESLESLELRKRQEKERSEQAFALERFYLGGGQELVQIFGADRVFDAMNGLLSKGERQDRQELPNMLDLIKKLAPDADERKKVYDRMETLSKNFVKAKDEEEQKLTQSGDNEAYQRFLEIYRGGMGADQNSLLSKKFTIDAMRTMDTLLGRLFSGQADKSQLNFGTHHLISEGFRGNLDLLKQELTAPGREDFLVTTHEIRSQVDKDKAERMQQAAELYKKCEQEIQRITLELNNKLAERVNRVLVDLQSSLEKHAGNEAGEKMIASIAEAVQKDIDAFQEATNKEVEQKTAKLRETRERAAYAAQSY